MEAEGNKAIDSWKQPERTNEDYDANVEGPIVSLKCDESNLKARWASKVR